MTLKTEPTSSSEDVPMLSTSITPTRGALRPHNRVQHAIFIVQPAVSTASKRIKKQNSGPLIRVRTGCLTCRVRRVKCDEGRPACARCLKSQYFCCGYPDGRSRKTRPLMPALNEKTNEADDELACRLQAMQTATTTATSRPSSIFDRKGVDSENSIYFDMFRDEVANNTCMIGGNARTCFLIILGESFHDESIFQSTLAVGAVSVAMAHSSWVFHQDKPFSPEGENDVTRKHYYASLKYHAKALTSFRQRMQDASDRPSTRTILMMTLLLGMYECQLGSLPAADAILESGSAIVDHDMASLGPAKSLDWDMSEVVRVIQLFGYNCKSPRPGCTKKENEHSVVDC